MCNQTTAQTTYWTTVRCSTVGKYDHPVRAATFTHLALNVVVLSNELHAAGVAACSVLAAEEVVGEAAGAIVHSPAVKTTIHTTQHQYNTLTALLPVLSLSQSWRHARWGLHKPNLACRARHPPGFNMLSLNQLLHGTCNPTATRGMQPSR
jgi:hypothetical protein